MVDPAAETLFLRTAPPLEQRRSPGEGALDIWLRRVSMSADAGWRRWRQRRAVAAALRVSETHRHATMDDLLARWHATARPAAGPRAARPSAERLGLVRRIAARCLHLEAHPVQLLATVALSERMAVEMATGEGKTLVTAMAAALQAAEGWPVHVITANDYLAARDEAAMRPLFLALGLRSGAIAPEQDPAERRMLYARDIVYASAKEIAFDHLRDRIALGETTRRGLKLAQLCGTGRPPVMRGLWSAIVDEADNVLIDEARTPLVISGSDERGAAAQIQAAKQAVALARHLQQDHDYRRTEQGERLALTPSGHDRVAQAGAALGGLWAVPRRAAELAETALYALHDLRRDVDYICRDGAVQIVDENTGRVLADRQWSAGLQQMVEVKEGLAPSGARQVLGRLTFQRFFRRYRRLSGTSGTLREVSGELVATYGLGLVVVPPHQRSRRRVAPAILHDTAAQKWDAAARAAERHAAAGRPVLLATRTVAGAAAASAALASLGLPHRVLSAAQDAAEAEIVAAAGVAGAITVATNMAGRGTDIRPDPAALEAGGLVVLIAERHDARRIDRQLMGRCARQGEPGLVETHLSREDALVAEAAPATVRLADFDRAQRRLERRQAAERRALNRQEEQLDRLTAFAGGLE
jgi:preprotein translocase subunit SecA